MLESLSLFATSATAIVIEAVPFLLLGSLVGACIEVFVPSGFIHRYVPRSVPGQVALAVCAGLVMPTCECGVVPVARRLLLKGMPAGMAITYMLAAPVVNPVVIASTLFAFQGDLAVAAARCALVVVTAAAMGFALSRAPGAAVLNAPPVILRSMRNIQAVAPDEGREPEPGCPCCGPIAGGGRLRAVLGHARSEFLSMFRFLVMGAVAAAAFKTFVPLAALDRIAGSALLSIGGLMLLAVLLSICSEADAFVAAAFSAFPTAAKVAFMAIGPMVDLKLIPMFFLVFHRRVAVALVLVPTAMVFIQALILAWGGL